MKTPQVADIVGNINMVFVSHLAYAKCYSEYIESRKRKRLGGALKSAPFVFLGAILVEGRFFDEEGSGSAYDEE